mmetsp:Transcript_44888/g.74495  ORF Transcript_44888/g.74495 Transcript_44888/m.74495 type:complete len:241 (+) Transcript_44888:59-781(+)
MPGELLQPVSLDGTYRAGPLIEIDQVHRLALPHKGVWLHVLTQDFSLLLVTRALQMKTCPQRFSIIGEHHLGREADAVCAQRAAKEELPFFTSLPSHTWHLQQLRPRARWFLYNYEDRIRFDRVLISEWVLRLDLNRSAANILLQKHRSDADIYENEAARIEFVTLHSFVRRLLHQPSDFCASPLFPRCLLDSIRDVCALIVSVAGGQIKRGCNEIPPAAVPAMLEHFDDRQVVQRIADV